MVRERHQPISVELCCASRSRPWFNQNTAERLIMQWAESNDCIGRFNGSVEEAFEIGTLPGLVRLLGHYRKAQRFNLLVSSVPILLVMMRKPDDAHRRRAMGIAGGPSSGLAERHQKKLLGRLFNFIEQHDTGTTAQTIGQLSTALGITL